MLKNGVFIPELLLPAGNMKKLKTAFYFGADAVYAGGKELSLRAFADNFSDSEIAEAAEYAHSLGKKFYVTANIYAKDADFKTAEKHFRFIEGKADAVLISDPGLFYLCRQAAPSLPVHISTQASTSNCMAAKFWHEQGAQRVVPARECTFSEIKSFKKQLPTLEIEIFVHGAMCVGMSGRCLLSSYFTGKSANSGECAQPCRWNYTLIEPERHQDKVLDVEQDDRGTYFLNSRDLNLLNRLPEISRAGIDSIKVEGRMKSEYYVATVANAYRRALDEYAEYGEIKNAPLYNDALLRVSRRAYTQAFFDGNPVDTISYECDKLPENSIFTAVVQAFGYEACEPFPDFNPTLNGAPTKDPISDNFTYEPAGKNNVRESLTESNTIGYAKVEMRNRFQTGDTLMVLSPNQAEGKSFKVSEIFTSCGEPVTDAKLVQHNYTIAAPIPLSPGDILLNNNDKIV